ncbi:hypothetical protein AB0F92_25715 [Kitasatospora aureofaciens]|uniref:hypothetical protein n=1 Tax=Kitasatospora aureofaciens TaxID=1894 RepID=UPI0009280695|nr:hypothetical protein BOQ63_009315 [Streptomyces viridifaciens]
MLRALDEEQLAESARLAEAERQASLTVTAHSFWATLSGEDRVIARSKLKHVFATAEVAA